MMTGCQRNMDANGQILADRIIQLGGTPVLNPDDWAKIAKCKYELSTFISSILSYSENCGIFSFCFSLLLIGIIIIPSTESAERHRLVPLTGSLSEFLIRTYSIIF